MVEQDKARDPDALVHGMPSIQDRLESMCYVLYASNQSQIV